MLKQISLKNSKKVTGIFKTNLNKQLVDEMYKQYVINAIKEAEEDIANGGKTYTLEEYRERMKQLYRADL